MLLIMMVEMELCHLHGFVCEIRIDFDGLIDQIVGTAFKSETTIIPSPMEIYVFLYGDSHIRSSDDTSSAGGLRQWLHSQKSHSVTRNFERILDVDSGQRTTL
jgi:hypothetical protein